MGRRAPYADRRAAGDVLARELAGYAGRDDVVVLALPRGGVPVAARIAAALHAPLDIALVRKLGLPQHAELAMGAIASVGDALEMVVNEDVLVRAGVGQAAFDEVCRRETEELLRRGTAYRGERRSVALLDRVVILVDDGLATGATMRAAVAAVRNQQPREIVVAVPIGARATCAELAVQVDTVVCPYAPADFRSVGQGYADFSQTSDAEVQRLLAPPS
jgi:putative phosphoribosyl transferase